MSPRPLSITSPGFSTMHPERPALSKSASDSNLTTSELGIEKVSGEEYDDGSHNLNKEVAALSNKLISAINHQTKLDDSLSATKHELELSKARIRQLEAVAKEHADMMAKGLLVEKKEMETETKKLLKRLKEESIQRGKAEKDKRTIEQELENLTTALFDEANKMVSAARKERDAMDRKNDLLRAQLKDTEGLLASHQEQLAELKAVMQQMTTEREENDGGVSTGTPATPALGNRVSKDSMVRAFEALHLAPNSSTTEEIPPCPPTSLTNLIHPILRHDIAAYRDFCEVLHAPKVVAKASPLGRLSSGSFTGMQVMGIGISPSPNHSPNSSLSFFGRKEAEPTSNAPSPASSLNASNNAQQIAQGLRETKFYKRTLVEDIEPTLRLDNAPGLSWLARRNVLSAITEGSLLIDPMPSSPRVNIFSCSLCGETRADEQHAREHRMRTNDAQNAQRYPVCGYCVNRLRSVCDFLAFLRTLKEGLWKCENEGDEKHAWEESVKLRERMFWSRIGGGVVPAFIYKESRRSSLERSGDVEQDSVRIETPPRTPQMKAIDEPVKLEIPKKRQSRSDPFLTPERSGMGKGDSPAKGANAIPVDDDSESFVVSEGVDSRQELEEVVVKALDGTEQSDPEHMPLPDVIEDKELINDIEQDKPEESTLSISPRTVQQGDTHTPLRDANVEDLKVKNGFPVNNEKKPGFLDSPVKRPDTPPQMVPGGW